MTSELDSQCGQNPTKNELHKILTHWHISVPGTVTLVRFNVWKPKLFEKTARVRVLYIEGSKLTEAIWFQLAWSN